MIKVNLTEVQKTIPSHVNLVAVSKTKPVSDIQEAYDAGQKVFGENKIQEMVSKYDALPKDIEWHMIGHLQRNKVKHMAHFVSLIHGVDSFKTLIEINKQAEKYSRIINCLLQAKIANEDSKFGLSFTEIETILNSNELKSLKNVHVSGLMGMSTFTDNKLQILNEFESLQRFYLKMHKTHPNLKILSMGMSGDYQLAIEKGSNMVRIGSSIFGVRNYNA